MVIILMGQDEVDRAIVAGGLSVALGWQVLEARSPQAIRNAVARTLDRREHLTITSGPLTPGDQQFIRGDRHGVRFVDLAAQRGEERDIVRAIRYEFGL